MYKLTLALGFPHPDYLKPLLTRSQFIDWAAFVKVCGPIGGDRLDYLAAFIAKFASGAEKVEVDTFQQMIPWVESVFTEEDDEYELEPGELDFDDEE